MFEPDLETRDVLFDLLDKGQMPRQLSQTFVGLDVRRIDRRRAGCDQSCIEQIVLGPAQMDARIGLHLDRLQDEDDEASLAQMSDHAALIASRRFDADTRDTRFAELCRQTAPAA